MRPSMICLALLALVSVLFTGCAGSQTFSTGVPSSSSDKFFFHVEQEALHRGYNTYASSTRDSLDVRTDLGDLYYSPSGDEIVVTVTIDPDGLTPQELDDQILSLKELSEELIDGAVERAERVRAFD